MKIMHFQGFRMKNTRGSLIEFINERSQVEERLSTIDEELKKEERNLQKVTSFTASYRKVS